MQPITLSTLGAVRVRVGEQELVELPAQRLRCALLVYLAVERDVGRETLSGLLWPDRSPIRARHAFRQMLYELRQTLGTDWVDVGRDRIVTRGVEVDCFAFEAAVAAGRIAEALALYRGGFLQDFALDNASFESWAERRRAHLARLHRKLRREHLASLVAAGDIAASLACAQDWVAVDPLEDEAAHSLVELLAASGQRAAALQFYQRYERMLAEELEVTPLDETRALIQRIQTEDHVPLDAKPQLTVRRGDVVPVAPREPEAPVRPPARRWRLRPLALAASAVILLAAAIAGAPMLRDRGPNAVSAPEARLAVLPFSDQSEDAGLQYLADAVTENLTRELAGSEALEVVSPHGVRFLRERGTPQDSISQLLGIDLMVGGSVTRAGDRIRVGLELFDAGTGNVILSTIVERPWGETLGLIDDVVYRASLVLRRELGGEVEVRRWMAETRSETAWQLVLQAKAAWAPLGRLMRDGELDGAERELARADSLLRLAEREDRAWLEPVILRGWLAERRAFVARLPGRGDLEAARAALQDGLAHAGRALASNPRDAAGLELKGALQQELSLLTRGEPEVSQKLIAGAERDLKAAVGFDPKRHVAWQRLGDVLFAQGRYAEAKNAAERAYALDAFLASSSSLINRLFLSSLELGEDESARQWCAEGSRRFPDDLPFLYCQLALHAWADGIRPDPVRARAELDRFATAQLAMQPPLRARMETLLAGAYARAGNADSAHAMLARVTAYGAGDPGVLWLAASVHVALGEVAPAVALLRQYAEGNRSDVRRVIRSRPFWALREQPAYRELLQAYPLP